MTNPKSFRHNQHSLTFLHLHSLFLLHPSLLLDTLSEHTSNIAALSLVAAAWIEIIWLIGRITFTGLHTSVRHGVSLGFWRNNCLYSCESGWRLVFGVGREMEADSDGVGRYHELPFFPT